MEEFIKSKGLENEYKLFVGKKSDLHQRVRNLPCGTDEWKSFVDDTDVVENVCEYLRELYPCLKLVSGNRELFKERIKNNWEDFQFMVIRELKTKGCFNQLENKNIFDDEFDDPAGGTGEVVQSVALHLMKEILK